MVVLGVELAAGVAYFALVESPAKLRLRDADRLGLATGIGSSAQLRDLVDRFRQEVHRVEAEAVALAHTRKYSSWTWSDAFTRASMEAGIMLACEGDSSTRYVCVRSDGRAARAAGVPYPPNHAVRLAGMIQGELPKYWQQRSVALFAALAVVGGYS